VWLVVAQDYQDHIELSLSEEEEAENKRVKTAAEHASLRSAAQSNMRTQLLKRAEKQATQSMLTRPLLRIYEIKSGVKLSGMILAASYFYRFELGPQDKGIYIRCMQTPEGDSDNYMVTLHAHQDVCCVCSFVSFILP
jgi:hypothetical protein